MNEQLAKVTDLQSKQSSKLKAPERSIWPTILFLTLTALGVLLALHLRKAEEEDTWLPSTLALEAGGEAVEAAEFDGLAGLGSEAAVRELDELPDDLAGTAGAKLLSLVELALADQQMLKAEWLAAGEMEAVLAETLAKLEELGWRVHADLVEEQGRIGAVLVKQGDTLNVRLQDRGGSVIIVAVVTRAVRGSGGGDQK